MKTDRRAFVRRAGAGTLGAALLPALATTQAQGAARETFDVAVVGAGVFGAWIADRLARRGARVALCDAYGAGNARSSSGGQTRVIRMGYGDKELYTRWSLRSLELWKALGADSGAPLFQPTGVLWLARGEDPLTTATLRTLARLGVRHERLTRAELVARWPQIDPGPATWAIHEPESGLLMACDAVQAVARRAVASGVVWLHEAVTPPAGHGRVSEVVTSSGRVVRARTFVFACGPWLPKLFPELLGERIFPTRQEVFYFGPPRGDARFQAASLPVWVDFAEEIYGLPDVRGRGFKVALDRHGPKADPDHLERAPDPESLARVREFVARRFPGLRDAPLVGAEVCQYENTSNGDFLIDRHPDFDNLWLVGGGSGHGFKHGPALGEHVTALLLDGAPGEPAFSLATKARVQRREVY